MKPKLKEKCVVVLSGVPDSSTLAYWAKDQGYDVSAITFNYGQISLKEIEHAKIIAIELNIPQQIIDLSSLKHIFQGVTSLVDEKIEMTRTFSQPIIVPFRNAILLSVAVAYASSINATRILYGATLSDAQNYPDCREEFYKSFEKTARLGTETQIVIDAPFSDKAKSKVIKLGVKLGVPYDLTWSCYLNKETHCGKCESCRNRKNAFIESGISDPTKYLH